jgi:hypothetical protein
MGRIIVAMDQSLGAAARALSLGDPLGALSRVALRDDPTALALRGIALAQLGELAEARTLLRRAGRGFAGPHAALSRARCLAAEAEVALAARELAVAGRDLQQALRTFEAHGDRSNAAHVRLLQLRRLLLLGRVGDAELLQAGLDLRGAPARLQAIAALGAFELAVRRGHSAPARRALIRAGALAARAAVPALVAEIEQAGRVLLLPAAQLVARGQARPVTLAEVEDVLAASDLVVDACRRVLRRGPRLVELVRRPVLFALARALAEAWPAPATRARLIERAFGVRRANASHRARLRVELGRLRALLRGIAAVRAVPDGFGLELRSGEVVTLAPPFAGDVEAVTASLLALLADGQAWSTAALALALGISQRTVQRALSSAESVRTLGRGRAQRWLAAPLPGFTPALLLPTAPAIG